MAKKPAEKNLSMLVRHAAVIMLLFVCPLPAERLTLSPDERPNWLGRDGIVMAGSWEPLLFRVRRDGRDGYTPTAEQRAAYLTEHAPQMVARLKRMGVNFVMMHCYKGAGLAAERQSMSDAVTFATLCRDAGLRVGVYNYSGAFLWELLFKETPQAEQWVLLDERGRPRTYGSAAYRYYWNRNHPDAQAFYRNVISFAANEIKADLLHFDNYVVGPGSDANSVQRFRDYLRDTFTTAQLSEMGASDLDNVTPPMTARSAGLLRRAWLDFSSQSLADSYYDASRYARTLRKGILIECNPGGPGDRIIPPVDHGRLLQGGEAFWDEGREPGYRNGRLYTRIRTYKVARRMDNMAFAYTTTPLEMAESMAFNLDCLGCVCWFEYGRIVARPASNDPVSSDLAPFIEFFHNRRDLLSNARVVADAAVLRSFPSQAFADPGHAGLTHKVEQTLIDDRVCFQIIYDHHLDDLRRYRVLVLAGCVALSNEQVAQIRRYVQTGGRLCVIGPAGTHDRWLIPRAKSPFDNLPQTRVLTVPEGHDITAALRQSCNNDLTLSLSARPGLCAELTEQPQKRLLHLVNYRADDPAKNVGIAMRLTAECHVEAVTLVGPGRQDEIKLPFETNGRVVEFTVPQVDIYEIAIITTSSAPAPAAGVVHD